MEFNDVRLQYQELAEEIDAAVGAVFASGRYILGPRLEAFERAFAAYCGATIAVGVASGTDALRIALSDRPLAHQTGRSLPLLLQIKKGSNAPLSFLPLCNWLC